MGAWQAGHGRIATSLAGHAMPCLHGRIATSLEGRQNEGGVSGRQAIHWRLRAVEDETVEDETRQRTRQARTNDERGARDRLSVREKAVQ